MTDRLPRLVATDLDGTLLGTGGLLSQRTREALDAIRAHGVELLLVTGRPPRWIPPVLEACAHEGFVIAANGALILTSDLGEIVDARLLLGADALAFARALREADANVAFAAERESGFSHEHGYRPRWADPSNLVMDLDPLLTDPLTKLLVRHEDLTADELFDLASEVARDHPVSLTHSSTEGLLEVSASGVNKAAAVEWCAGQLGIDSADVLAFGDMPNDAPMLAWAGRSYSVANAHPRAVEAAKSSTLSNDDDGVAVVLEALLAGEAI